MISGLIVFESVSVVFFALGLYSQAQLARGAYLGIVTGACFGPVFAVLRTPRGQAALWEASLLALRYLAVGISWIASGSVFTSVEEAVTTVICGIVYYALAGSLAGAATAWSVSRLADSWLPAPKPQPRSSSATNRERRYRL